MAISFEAVSIERTEVRIACSVVFRVAMVWSSAREVSAISSRPVLPTGGARRPSDSSATTSEILRMSASMARRTSIVTSSDSAIDSTTSTAMVTPSERNSAPAAA